MKIFLAGGTGVVGSRALPALVAAGYHVTAVARTEAKADLVRSLERRAGGGGPVRRPTPSERGHRPRGGHQPGHQHPAPHQGGERRLGVGHQRAAAQRASNHLVDGALHAGAGRFVQESITFRTSTTATGGSTRDHPVDHIGPFTGARDAEAAAARFAEHGGAGGAAVRAVLRPGQHPHAGLQRDHAPPVSPFLGPRGLHVVHPRRGRGVRRGRGATSAQRDAYNVVDDEPVTRAEAGRIVAEALGVKQPYAVPKVVRAVTPASVKLLMRSLRVSNRRFKDATGWRPAHPSIRGSWPA
jgi:nucleoside-diphosphate-sugar epimerase